MARLVARENAAHDLIGYDKTVTGLPDTPNSLYQGDCLELLARMQPETLDLTVFSPPYDNIRDYAGNWTFNFPELGCQLHRVTKPGGVVAVVIGDGTKDFAKSLTSFRLAIDWCDHAGWRLFETCIYHRDGNPGAWWRSRFRVDHEFIHIFFKGAKPKTFHKEALVVPSKHAGKTYSGTDRLTNGGFKTIEPGVVQPTKCRGTVWKYSTSNAEGNKLKLQHPATYPDRLAEDLIKGFSNVGDLVFDPMMGSGTTCVMAAKHGRQYMGIDMSDSYCEVAHSRLLSEVYQRLRIE